MNTIDVVDPAYPADDLYGIVGDNLKKSFDVREVSDFLFSRSFYFRFFATVLLAKALWSSMFHAKFSPNP